MRHLKLPGSERSWPARPNYSTSMHAIIAHPWESLGSSSGVNKECSRFVGRVVSCIATGNQRSAALNWTNSNVSIILLLTASDSRTGVLGQKDASLGSAKLGSYISKLPVAEIKSPLQFHHDIFSVRGPIVLYLGVSLLLWNAQPQNTK